MNQMPPPQPVPPGDLEDSSCAEDSSCDTTRAERPRGLRGGTVVVDKFGRRLPPLMPYAFVGGRS